MIRKFTIFDAIIAWFILFSIIFPTITEPIIQIANGVVCIALLALSIVLVYTNTYYTHTRY